MMKRTGRFGRMCHLSKFHYSNACLLDTFLCTGSHCLRLYCCVKSQLCSWARPTNRWKGQPRGFPMVQHEGVMCALPAPSPWRELHVRAHGRRNQGGCSHFMHLNHHASATGSSITQHAWQAPHAESIPSHTHSSHLGSSLPPSTHCTCRCARWRSVQARSPWQSSSALMRCRIHRLVAP